MWIIPKNLYGTCPSVQDTEGSTLDSEEFCQSAEQSLMWRSKRSLSKTWFTRLKRNDWIQHLYTRTLSPSHSKSFVDAWTSYQEASLVNLSVRQVLKDRLKTLGISSPTSSKESESADPQLSFLKMSKASSQVKQGTENPFSNMSSKAWKKWVTQQRQEYSQRQKLAHHIRESESLSWATPNTMDHMAERSQEAMERQFATHRKGRTRPSNLREQVNWPTARTSDAEGGPIETELSDQGFRSKRHKSDQWFGAKLRDAVETLESWPTPTVAEADKIGGRANFGQKGLNNHPAIRGEPERDKLQKDRKGSKKQWATPTSRDWKGSYKPESLTRKDGRSRLDALPQMAEYDPTTWPTPAARDYKGANGLESTQKKIREGKRANMGQLPNAIMIVGHQDQTNPNTTGKNPGSWATPNAGDGKAGMNMGPKGVGRQQKSLGQDVSKSIGGFNPRMKLNPNWVEQLMGLPVGWTQIETEQTD